jgi:tRNA threonylcarbamoyladenosine biosynthesis protein TsaE
MNFFPEKQFTKLQTRNFIREFAVDFLKKYLKKKKTLIILLQGELGAGKTQVVKWLAQNLGIKQTIQSPTFVLWKSYPFGINTGLRGISHGQTRKDKNLKILHFNHIDLYRLKNPGEIFKLLLRKKLKEPNNLFLIEWGERIEKYLKVPFIKLRIEISGRNKRRIAIINSNVKTDEINKIKF